MTITAPTEADLIRQAKNMPAEWQNLGYHELNAMLNLYGADGRIQFEADHAAARQYFLQHVNTNTVFFHDLEEKLDYLQKNDYYETETFEQYPFEFIRGLFDRAYKAKFRFPTFLGAFKFYTSYALKTFDGKRYLERYEDRVAVVALHLARGDQELATHLVDEMIAGRFQPATPTFLNSGKKQRGELVSCFLLRIEDNMESIARGINSALQLSKRGGGVALSLTNIREHGAPIKQIENQSSGVIPVMKLLEDSFSYANQLGARQGAGAVYLNAHHPDIHRFLDTKRENADEKIRIKTLSLGVVIPDITFELAKRNEDLGLGGITMFILYQIIITATRNLELLPTATAGAQDAGRKRLAEAGVTLMSLGGQTQIGGLRFGSRAERAGWEQGWDVLEVKAPNPQRWSDFWVYVPALLLLAGMWARQGRRDGGAAVGRLRATAV